LRSSVTVSPNKFFEPIPSGVDYECQTMFMASGIAQLAASMYSNHARQIMEEVWQKLDLDQLAEKVAERIADEGATKAYNGYDYRRKSKQEEPDLKVRELLAAKLAERALVAIDAERTESTSAELSS
jgi:hypothetical protein